MPHILVAMSADTYAQVMSDGSRAGLAELGDVEVCLDGPNLGAAAYRELWDRADVCVSGWGVRAPEAGWFGEHPRLKAVCHSAGSVRMFPRELIERGVIVTSARGAIARTVAEFALASMLTLLRRMVELQRPGGPRPVSETLFDKTVALVGLGCVGRSLLDLLRPFGCKVLVVDPFLAEPEAERLDVEQVSLPEALGRATVVSLHAPDVPETRGMIGAAELAAMPDGAVLVNTARGRLIDTRALTACASTGRLRVALDVTDPEPLPLDHPLRLMANVIVTPHVAGPTTDDLPRLGEAAVAEVGRVLRGEPPMHAITATDYDRMSF